jgi:hypothetical protein
MVRSPSPCLSGRSAPPVFAFFLHTEGNPHPRSPVHRESERAVLSRSFGPWIRTDSKGSGIKDMTGCGFSFPYASGPADVMSARRHHGRKVFGEDY